jgi:hypothetical protein
MILIGALAALCAVTGSGLAEASPIVYLRSTVGTPWGTTTNEQALDLAFGAGNWDDLRYETVNVGTLFSGATRFIFMEGGDFLADELEAFLGANQAALENWVAGGGSVFINAAPNEGDGMSYGFGGVTLTYADFSSTGTAANGAHPIFNGPFVPASTNYTGNYFSHASVSGGGITGLILDDNGDFILATRAFGAGHAMFGGMTTTNWHDPDPNAFNLRANILAFGAVAAVPEPATLSLLGLGCLAGVRRLRKK